MSAVKMGRPIEILLVEDSPTDILLTKEVFTDAKVRNNMHVVENGVEALAYLRKEGAYANANCYVTKPVDLEQFISVVRSIEEFWFTVVTLPLE